MLALGVLPVGMPRANYGQVDKNGMLAWTARAVTKLGGTGDKLPKVYDETDSINTEAISDTEPDLILGISSGVTKEQYATLSEIAPTIPYTSKIPWGATWRDVMRVTAKAMGRTSMRREGDRRLRADDGLGDRQVQGAEGPLGGGDVVRPQEAVHPHHLHHR